MTASKKKISTMRREKVYKTFEEWERDNYLEATKKRKIEVLTPQDIGIEVSNETFEKIKKTGLLNKLLKP